MTGIFRTSKGVRRDPAVDAWLREGHPELCKIAREWFTEMRRCFFHGAFLEDPAGLLEGSGKRMRHMKLHPGQKVNAAALRKLIDAACVDIRARLNAERLSRKGDQP